MNKHGHFNIGLERFEGKSIEDIEDDVDKAFKFLQMPPLPEDAWKFIEESQKANERATCHVQKEHH